jgi:hypothetical protein
MSEASYELAVVCEARADRDTACGLADRVLLEAVSWLAPETLDSCRSWRGLRSEEPYLRWASVKDEARKAGLKIFGQFNGEPGQADAVMARRALLLLLTAREHGAKKDAKVALDALTRGDPARERACLAETPLARLEERGPHTGLSAFLKEVRERLVPVMSGRSPHS